MNTYIISSQFLDDYLPGHDPDDHSGFPPVPDHAEGGSAKTIYIAGPMRGHDLLNWPSFFAEERRWIDAGWKTVNPASHDIIEGIHPDTEVSQKKIDDLLAWDLNAVGKCDAMVLLPGWTRSEGAMQEAQRAGSLSKPIWIVASGGWHELYPSNHPQCITQMPTNPFAGREPA